MANRRLRCLRPIFPASCLIAILASNAAQVAADLGPGIQTELETLGYALYNSTDYVPTGPSDDAVADLKGALATTVVACAEACEETAACNGASFYPDPDTYFGKAGMKNCWMKTVVDACELPEGAYEDPLGHFLLKPNATCPTNTTAAPSPGAAALNSSEATTAAANATNTSEPIQPSAAPAAAPEQASAPTAGTADDEKALETDGQSTGKRNFWYLAWSGILVGCALLVCCCIGTFLHFHRMPGEHRARKSSQEEIISVSAANEAAGGDSGNAQSDDQ